MRYLFASLLVLLLVLPVRAQQLNPGGGIITSGNAVFPPGPVSITGNSANGSDQMSGVTVYPYATTFANLNLGSPTNGAMRYCSDCTIANPCAGGGTGAIAKRLNNVWVCN